MNIKQIRNTLLLVLTALIWGCTFVALSVGAEYVGALTFLASRCWVAGIVLLAVVAATEAHNKRTGKPTAAPQTREAKRTLVTGGIACGIFLFLAASTQQIGIAQTTTAKASFITTLYVLIVPFLTLFMGRKVGKKIWICVVLGVVGLYLLCITGGFSLSWGDTMVLICAFFFACHILTIDHFSPKTDALRMSCIQFFAAATLSTICMFLFEHPTWANIQAAILPILYAGIMGYGVGFTLQIVAQKDLNPTIASLAMSLEGVFGALAGWVLLGQVLTVREFIGCVLMFAAIVLAQLPDEMFSKKKRSSSEP